MVNAWSEAEGTVEVVNEHYRLVHRFAIWSDTQSNKAREKTDLNSVSVEPGAPDWRPPCTRIQ